MRMTAEKGARLKELQALHKMARNAADYLNKKADECINETRRALYIELAETATAEADKYFEEETPLWNDVWSDFCESHPDDPFVKEQLAKYPA